MTETDRAAYTPSRAIGRRGRRLPLSIWSFAGCVAAVASLLVAQAGQGDQRWVAITGGTVLDVRAGTRAADMTILIHGDRIRQVGRSGEVPVPNGAAVLQAKGRWIVPGFIDMHVHVSTISRVPLELYVVNGVTAIRDLGGNITTLRLIREASETAERPQPRLFFAGAILDGVPPSAPRISIIADSPKRSASAVNFLVDQTADAVKVYNAITEPVLEAIVMAASARGVPVVGHIPRALTVSRAVQLGLTGIEHAAIRSTDLEDWGVLTAAEADQIQSITSVTQRNTLVWNRVDLNAPSVRAMIADMVSGKVFFDPTLSIDEYDTLFLYDVEAGHPNNRYLSASFVEATLGPEHNMFRVPAEMRAAAEAGLARRRQFVAMSHRAGVTILAGTDGPGIGRLVAGFGLHRELALLVEAGLTPLAALRAATLNAARALRQEKILGAVEPGKLADLVVLNADPLEDIRNSTSIDAVVVRGRVLDRAALDSLLNQIETAARKGQ